MNLTSEAAVLRAKGSLKEAVDLAINNYRSLNDGTEVTLLLQGLYASEELKDKASTDQIVKILKVLEPGLPALKKYL